MQSPEGCRRCGILTPSRPCQGCPAVSDGQPEVGGSRLHDIQHHRRMVPEAPLSSRAARRPWPLRWGLCCPLSPRDAQSGSLHAHPLPLVALRDSGHLAVACRDPWARHCPRCTVRASAVLLPVGKRRHRTVRELPRVPRLRPECPGRCGSHLSHPHPWLQPLSRCHSAGAVFRWPAGPAQAAATEGEAIAEAAGVLVGSEVAWSQSTLPQVQQRGSSGLWKILCWT